MSAPEIPRTRARTGAPGRDRTAIRKAPKRNAPRPALCSGKPCSTAAHAPAPTLSWVSLAYLPKNVAPRITAVAVQNPGIRVASFGTVQQAGPGAPALPCNCAFRRRPYEDNELQAPRPPAETPRFDVQPQGFAQKGYQAVFWSAEDANDDELTYSIYYRGEDEKDWKLLKDKLDQKFYSWDTTSMPDGAYYLKIVASDERSNPPGDALTAERLSDRFVVDNTPPEISGSRRRPSTAGGDPSVTVHFHATDATSAIVRAQYSLDAGDWTLTLPEHGLSDSLDERYAIPCKVCAGRTHPGRSRLRPVRERRRRQSHVQRPGSETLTEAGRTWLAYVEREGR